MGELPSCPMDADELAKRQRLSNRKILRDVAALKSYIDDGWPVWKIAERHGLQRAEVRRALERDDIYVPRPE